MHTKELEPLRAPPWYLIAVLLAAAVCRTLYLHWLEYHGLSLQSFTLLGESIYANALRDWRSGLDPYRTAQGAMRFVYPPAFLYVGGFLARVLPGQVGWYLYPTILVASIVALPVVLARFYFCQTWLNAGFALLIFFGEPRLTGILALINGNIASILYLIAFVAGVPGLRTNRWALFYVAVFVAAIVKGPFLLLLLLPLLTGTRQWRNSALCVAALVMAYLLQRAAWPELYAGYSSSLEQELTLFHHYGYGIWGLAAGLEYKLSGGFGRLASVLSGLLSMVLILALFVLRPRISSPGCNCLWISLVLLSSVLANPRILPYDADIALMAAYVIFVIVLQTRRLLLLLILLFLPSLFVPHLVHASSLAGSYETLLLLLAFAVGFFRLWKQSAPLKCGEPQPV
ncbi:MAG: hypothetical protein JOZ33_08070 [Acidobacteriaceae bacterium]|nr:hypothetical protein [Acidobacteriaceae bacterium]